MSDVAAALAVQGVLQRVAACHRFAVDGDNQIAANAQLAEPAHDHHARGAAQAGGFGRRYPLHFLNQQPARRWAVRSMSRQVLAYVRRSRFQAPVGRCARSVSISSSIALARLMGMAKPMPMLPCDP